MVLREERKEKEVGVGGGESFQLLFKVGNSSRSTEQT